MSRMLLFSISTSANGSGWNAADVSAGRSALQDALEMIMDRDRERLLRDVLADHILVERMPDIGRFRDANRRGLPARVFV